MVKLKLDTKLYWAVGQQIDHGYLVRGKDYSYFNGDIVKKMTEEEFNIIIRATVNSYWKNGYPVVTVESNEFDVMIRGCYYIPDKLNASLHVMARSNDWWAFNTQTYEWEKVVNIYRGCNN